MINKITTLVKLFLVVFLAKTTMVFGSSVVYNECTSPECSGVVVTDLSLFSLRVHDQCAVLASPLRLVFISPPRLSLAFSSTVINFGTSWEECRGFSEDGEGGGTCWRVCGWRVSEEG